MGGIGRGSHFPEFPSVWPPYTLGALETLNVGEQPPLPTRCHDDNKHVSRHTPEQSAIRFTVHEIWQRFYWPKDLSVIIYRLLPRRLWCQRRFLHPRENQGESDKDGGGELGGGLEMSACVCEGEENRGRKGDGDEGRREKDTSALFLTVGSLSGWGSESASFFLLFQGSNTPPPHFLQRWHQLIICSPEQRREKSAVLSLGFLLLVARAAQRARPPCEDALTGETRVGAEIFILKEQKKKKKKHCGIKKIR